MSFYFSPAWKELLYVSGYGQTIILDDLPHTTKVTYLPSEEVWRTKAPDGLGDKWHELRTDLEAWCKMNGRELRIDDDAPLHQESTGKPKPVRRLSFWDWFTKRR
jgi:hypothetical protein